MRVSAARIVARDHELAAIRAQLEAARSCGRAIVLVGDAGMGKTRLAQECVAQATDRGFTVLHGRTGRVGARMPLRPLVEALSKQIVGQEDSGPHPLGQYRPALSRLVPQWQTRSAETPRPEALVELSEALLQLLTSIGATTGCLLWLEDLHDADPETMSVVEYLADNLADRPILLLTTMRPSSEVSDFIAAVEQRPTATVIDIAPLGGAGVRAMLATCLGLEADLLPEHMAEYMVRASGGSPYLIEVLISNLIDTGLLSRGPDGWQMPGHLEPPVPDTIVRSHERQLMRLDRRTRQILLTAAVLGERFALRDLTVTTGAGASEVVSALRLASSFVEPDRTSRDDYAFRHALTTEALIATLHPAEHAAVARSAAATLCDDDPQLEGERCYLVARLLEAAKETAAAARLYATAGRRALEVGALGSAVTTLRQATELASLADRPAIVATYIRALADDGQLDRALHVLRSPSSDVLGSIPADQKSALRARLAWAAVSMGRNDIAAGQLAQWEQQFGEMATVEDSAGLLVVRAYLTLFGDQEGSQRVRQAKNLAAEAATVAEQANLPEVACRAWQVLGLATRREEFEEAARYHQQMLAVSERHALPLWRADALLRLAGNHFMRTGSTDQFHTVRELTRSLGAQTMLIGTEAALAMAHVLRGEHDSAEEIVHHCSGPVARMKLHDTEGYLWVIRAVSAAHQGRRQDMNQSLTSFHQVAGDASFMTPLTVGLGRAFCALLEEQRDLALDELAQVYEWEEKHPAVYCTTGRFGLGLLLDAMHHRLTGDRHQELISNPAAGLKWNQQFALLSEAVLAGRSGHPERACELVERAARAGVTYPTAWHLGLRLVSQAALADGWGEPAQWFGRAEDYFHQAGIPSVASACRSMLRDAGVPARQRRLGVEKIPTALRERGVTVREYEVLAVMPDRPSNQQIARRLFISPRTAEKHVARLIVKLGVTDRHQLCHLAADSRSGVA